MNGYYNIIATQRISPKTDDPEMTLQICQIYRDVFDMRKTALEQAPKVGEQISAIFPERSDEIAELIEDVETGRQDITGTLKVELIILPKCLVLNSVLVSIENTTSNSIISVCA